MRALLASILLLLVLAAAATAATGTTIKPLTRAQGHAVLQAKEWHKGCPVVFSQLRVVTTRYWGFDNRSHWGRILVNAAVAPDVATIFERLYAMHFLVHHMQFGDTYGPRTNLPKDGDFTASFECREASASPCTGNKVNKTTGHWSMHAYGEAIDLNPVENPYVGCGMTRDPTALSYLDRGRVRKGMVTPAIVRVFASVGWEWGGAWAGSTKDYMHFSLNGH